MPKLTVAKDLLRDYARLDAAVQRRVDDVFSKFSEHTHAGLHLEKLKAAKDPRVRTIRITDNFRGIVMAPESGDTYVLVRVLPHQEADKWIEKKSFGVNQATGALEIVDTEAIERIAPTIGHAELGQTLFEQRSDKDFTRLGLPEGLLPVLRRISTEQELEGLCAVLPQGQADALSMLAAGYSVENAWAELVAGEEPGPVDPANVDAAVERPASQSMFYVVQGHDELADMLNRPFDLWRTFLHPAQRALAYRPVYNGPVRVSGGPGTGKTVVAMHRAKALADQAAAGERILFTTFTRNLADAIAESVKLLGGPELLERLEVLNVDRLAHQVVREVEGGSPKVVPDREQMQIWEDVVDEHGIPFPPTFLRQEWLHVVLAQGISSRDGYFTAKRPGRGVRLNRRERAEIWKGIEAFTNRLVEYGQRTFLEMASAAAEYLDARSVKPYAHVIVDEAQDLHAAQWRMLRAAVAEGPNDLFIVGDAHQRIYDHRVTLSSLGINVRGRSRRLRINYRTTHEILRWALGLLAGEAVDDLDAGTDTLAGYRSQMHGPEPTLAGYPTRAEELAALVAAIKEWMAAGVDPQGIGVFARTEDRARLGVKTLEEAGIPAKFVEAGETSGSATAVDVATMHRGKGLEYRCVAVIDAGKRTLPLPVSLTPTSTDPMQHDLDVKRERCLLYVACTRARDVLRVSWAGAPSSFLEALLPSPDQSS